MSQDSPKPFQHKLAIITGVLFIINFQVAEFMQSKNYLYVSQLLIGFNLGVVITFSLSALNEIFRGNLDRYIDSNPIFKPFSYLSMVVIFGMAILGIWSTNYHTISYGYNTAVLIGSIIAGLGLMPVVQHLDK